MEAPSSSRLSHKLRQPEIPSYSGTIVVNVSSSNMEQNTRSVSSGGLKAYHSMIEPIQILDVCQHVIFHASMTLLVYFGINHPTSPVDDFTHLGLLHISLRLFDCFEFPEIQESAKAWRLRCLDPFGLFESHKSKATVPRARVA